MSVKLLRDYPSNNEQFTKNGIIKILIIRFHKVPILVPYSVLFILMIFSCKRYNFIFIDI